MASPHQLNSTRTALYIHTHIYLFYLLPSPPHTNAHTFHTHAFSVTATLNIGVCTNTAYTAYQN